MNKFYITGISGTGKSALVKSEQEHVLSWYKDFEDDMLKKGAIPMTTEAKIGAAADRILSQVLPAA